TEVKKNILKVSLETIQEKGVVSKECATEMAANIREMMHAAIGISFTGIAGPGSVENKPVGTVYIGIVVASGESIVEGFEFHGDREAVRNQAVSKGYDMLYQFLSKRRKNKFRCQRNNKNGF